METTVPSPAKINLMLSVTGRREDGFHSLTSLVAPLEFGDSVRLSVEEGGCGIAVETTDPRLPVGRDNLAWQAADGFLERFGLTASVKIHIEKNVPIGAGLGGGSSNAAVVLKGLASLFEVKDRVALHELAASLGSDCPLFLISEPLVMRGRGDEIERLDLDTRGRLAGQSVVLFKPSFGISTAWAYQSLAESGAYTDQEVAEKRLEEWKGRSRSLGELLSNTFDSVVGTKYPSIPLLLEKVRSASGACCLMSGSGSACFALCDSESVGALKACVADAWGRKAFFQETRIPDIGLTERDGISF